jgi:hypothetical protein
MVAQEKGPENRGFPGLLAREGFEKIGNLLMSEDYFCSSFFDTNKNTNRIGRRTKCDHIAFGSSGVQSDMSERIADRNASA